MHGFTPSSLLLLLVAGAGLSSAAPIGLVLPAAAAISAVPSGSDQVKAAAPSSSVSVSLPASSAAVPITGTATATAASASSVAPASTPASASSVAASSSSKPTASASSTTAPLPTPSLCAGVVEWTGSNFIENDDGSIDTRMSMKTACPPGAKGIKLSIVDTSTCSPVTSSTRNLGFTTLEANVYDGDLKTISEGQTNDGTAVTLSCTGTDSVSLMGIFHGPKRVMSDALSFTAPKVEVV